MLQTLNIQNVALIPNQKLDLGSGLNVLTGETGSGKSIIIGSLNFVIGERADKTMIRNGCNFAKVEAVFSVNDCIGALNCLKEFGIECDDCLILTRLITIDGRSECRINGSMVTAQMLKQITSYLIDIHGQHDHQSLLQPKNHIAIIDSFAGMALNTYKNNLIKEYDKHSEITTQIASLGGSLEERQREADMLNYQIHEIETLKLNETEEEELVNTINRLNNVERIASGVSAAYEAVEGSEGVGAETLITSALGTLSSAVKYDNSLNSIYERLNSTRYELSDIAETLKQYASSLNYNQKEYDMLDSRLDAIKLAKKKYGSTIKEVLEFLKNAKERADILDHSEEMYAKLKDAEEKSLHNMYDLCVKIHDERISTAHKLEGRITQELKELGMMGSRFETQFSAKPDFEQAESLITKNGFEQVEFMFSANTGEPVKPLSKIISGGEMSRFMLGLKSIIADVDGISTMVFDEIDTGVSGKMGQIVATKLAKISQKHQVISVSHLPQIAAMADNHYMVSKQVIDGFTVSGVKKLNDEEQIAEIARLTGGSDIGTFALPHAKELKNWSNEFKKQIM